MKKNMRFFLALWVGKAAMWAQKRMGMNASYFPGKIALKLCPDFMGRVDKPKTIFGVTGTDGKTTTCNLLADVLSDQGYRVLSNRLGSNVDAGIASAILGGTKGNGKSKCNVAVFEIDERSSRKIYPYVKPDYVICTNLARDSVARNAHPEYIFNFISSAVPKTTTMILNADDRISSALAPDNKHVFFGIGPLLSDKKQCDNIVNDVRLCPVCHQKLEYDFIRNHDIGRAHCSSCGFRSPKPDYEATVDFEAMTMTVEKMTYPLKTDKLYFAYDELAVITALSEFGMDADKICSSLDKIKLAKSRYQIKKIGSKQLISNMTKGKNAIACSCVFDAIRSEEGTKELLLCLDDVFDKKNSSENVCWYYDTDFHFLTEGGVETIVAAGDRCEELKLAMMLAGVEEDRIIACKTLEDAVQKMPLKADKIYFLFDLYYYPKEAVPVLRGLEKRMQESEEASK